MKAQELAFLLHNNAMAETDQLFRCIVGIDVEIIGTMMANLGWSYGVDVKTEVQEHKIIGTATVQWYRNGVPRPTEEWEAALRSCTEQVLLQNKK